MSGIAKRFNEGKVDFTLIPVDAQEAEARVWMRGEAKYGRGNWEKLWGDQTITTVMKSLLRHANAILKGETHDPETGELHAAHIRCNAAMLVRYEAAKTPPQPSTEVRLDSARVEIGVWPHLTKQDLTQLELQARGTVSDLAYSNPYLPGTRLRDK